MKAVFCVIVVTKQLKCAIVSLSLFVLSFYSSTRATGNSLFENPKFPPPRQRNKFLTIHCLILRFIHILQHNKYSNQRHFLLAVTTIWSVSKSLHDTLVMILVLKYYSSVIDSYRSVLHRDWLAATDHHPSHYQDAKCKILIEWSLGRLRKSIPDQTNLIHEFNVGLHSAGMGTRPKSSRPRQDRDETLKFLDETETRRL